MTIQRLIDREKNSGYDESYSSCGLRQNICAFVAKIEIYENPPHTMKESVAKQTKKAGIYSDLQL
jgi:hypothetical protein